MPGRRPALPHGEAQFAILAFSTEIENAVELAERLRHDIRSRNIAHGNAIIRVTASCGRRCRTFPGGTTILTEAEEALRQARMAGGDWRQGGGPGGPIAVRLRN